MIPPYKTKVQQQNLIYSIIYIRQSIFHLHPPSSEVLPSLLCFGGKKRDSSGRACGIVSPSVREKKTFRTCGYPYGGGAGGRRSDHIPTGTQ